MKRWLALLLILVPAFVVAQEKTDAGAQPKIEKAIVFGKGGATNLEMNLALPSSGTGPFPAVVVIHGGGWKGGSYKDTGMNMIMIQLARRGYVAACIQYRLTPSGATFPSQVEDCKCAVRWLRANAEKYQIDTKRFGAIGASAGGHLSLMLGLTNKSDGLEGSGDLKPEYAEQSSQVHAVVNICGPVDLVTGKWEKAVQPLLDAFLGGPPSEKTDLAKKASPLTYVEGSRKLPPILTFHGTKDTTVPYVHATLLHEALDKIKSPGKLVTMEGEGHGWTGAKLDGTLKQTFEFFDENLKGKK